MTADAKLEQTPMNDSGTKATADAGLTQEDSRCVRMTLSSGHTVLFDSADVGLLSKYSWHLNKPGENGKNLYVAARVKGTGERIKMHRLLMGAPSGMVVHHKNNNGLDNRRCNLEVTTNRKNVKYAFEGKSTGVYFDKISGLWRVAIRASFGLYRDEAKAREIAASLQRKLEEHLLEIEPRWSA